MDKLQNYASKSVGKSRGMIASYHKMRHSGFSASIARVAIQQGITPLRALRRSRLAIAKLHPHLGSEAQGWLRSYRTLKSQFARFGSDKPSTGRLVARTMTQQGMCTVRAHTRNGHAVRQFQRLCHSVGR